MVDLKETTPFLFEHCVEHYLGVETVVVVAGGPSVELVDRSKVDANKQVIIACNTAYKLYPNALIAHHADVKWWAAHGQDLLATFTGKLITGAGMGSNITGYPPQVQHLGFAGATGIPRNLSSVSGMNAGQQGLSLAHCFQPKKIILLGFDHTRGVGGKSHWSDAQPLTEDHLMDDLWSKAMKWFDQFAQNRQQWWSDIGYKSALPEIINVSPISAITCFKKVDNLNGLLD